MSQQLRPIGEGIPQIQAVANLNRRQVLSPQYVAIKNLEPRATDWVPGGRPIYDRLPAISEAYRTDFFSIVPATNTAVRTQEPTEVGYVYIPRGEGIFGPTSLEVIASDTFEDVIIKSGKIVWKYGTIPVLPTLFNLRDTDYGSGRYLVAFQLFYDNAIGENFYAVEDYALTGTPLVVTSSTDSVLGWRHSPKNAFLNKTTAYWTNQDTFFPSTVQPTESFIQWRSNEFLTGSTTPLASAYSKVVLRCPEKTTFTGEASLSYINGTNQTVVTVSSISKDDISQFFEFNVDNPSYQTEWRVDFAESNMKIQSVLVSGVIIKAEKRVEPEMRAVLTLYPEEAVPKEATNAAGETVPAVYCKLAVIDVDANFKLTDIKDIRSIIYRDYTPVSDWLTRPFDENLISLFEQVKGYADYWMKPSQCVKQEYVSLQDYGVDVVQ